MGGDLAKDAVQDLLLPNERKGELAKDHVEAWKQTLGVDGDQTLRSAEVQDRLPVDLSSPPAKRPRAAEPFTMGLAVVRAKVLDGTVSNECSNLVLKCSRVFSVKPSHCVAVEGHPQGAAAEHEREEAGTN